MEDYKQELVEMFRFHGHICWASAAYILALTMREAAGADDCWTHEALGDYKTLLAEGIKSSDCCAR